MTLAIVAYAFALSISLSAFLNSLRRREHSGAGVLGAATVLLTLYLAKEVLR